MPNTGTLDEIRVACQLVIDGLPMGQLSAAHDRIQTAIREVVAAGSSRHPHYVASLDGLTALLTDIEQVRARLVSAAKHARRFQSTL